jgi:hypothetical protein
MSDFIIDPRVMALAEQIIGDTFCPENNRDELAIDIQNAVDTWLEFHAARLAEWNEVSDGIDVETNIRSRFAAAFPGRS